MSSELQGKRQPSFETICFILSEEFGWTPGVIRAMDAHDINLYWTMLNIRRSIEKAQSMKSQNKYGRK